MQQSERIAAWPRRLATSSQSVEKGVAPDEDRSGHRHKELPLDEERLTAHLRAVAGASAPRASPCGPGGRDR
jgi:hypothetical protein